MYREIAEKLNYNVNNEFDKLKLCNALHDVGIDMSDTGIELYYSQFEKFKEEFLGLDIEDFVEFIVEFNKLHNVAFFDGLRKFIAKELL